MKSIKNISVVVLLVLVFASCTQTNQYQQQANDLAEKVIIVDGHIDVPYQLKDEWVNISKAAPELDFDYPRAKEGGLDAPFMSIYIPVEYQETGGAKAAADSLVDMMEGIANDNPDKFAIATSPEEIQNNFEKGVISLPMGIENGAPVGEDLSDVQYFYDRGVRYITLAHAKDNRLSDSSYDTTADTHNGLSDYGEEVVTEMNRLGMMVDVSHITDSAFYDVMDVTEAPVVATHSSCRHFTPGFERNMSDDLIKRLGKNNGVIMINFGSTFLDSASQNSQEKVREEMAQLIEEKELDPESEEADKFRSKYFQENFQFSTVEKVADHIDHVVDLVGVDHVGLGSDYDGVGPTLPNGLKDVSTYPNLFAELLERGYTEEEIEKIASGNIFRVWNKVNEVADNMQESDN
ncbi:peptidase M19 [Aliifodinibius salipaludis]|uniref:Peptidase M19 n=1 Tax=Fodinibius salipaludis TaxID=2032627 RepID=A0A2A2G977_9BACT|nr:dipeptidase [Aliifodinibius salipaludis]PAU93858.1 peptidase M19 [Aliifodinibius salipaludis]